MVKIAGQLNAAFWGSQKRNPFRLSNNFRVRSIAYDSRKKTIAEQERLRNMSILPVASAAWRKLPASEKKQWRELGKTQGMNGWQAFVQARQVNEVLNNSELGEATFAELYFGGGSRSDIYNISKFASYKVMRLEIQPGVEPLVLYQEHLQNYKIRRRVPQSNQTFETIDVSEIVNSDIKYGLSYNSSDLTINPTNPPAVVLELFYEHENVIQKITDRFEINATTGWTRTTKTIKRPPGAILRYNLVIDLSDSFGVVDFDNIILIHDATNWAFDPRCSNATLDFSDTYAEVVRPWQCAERTRLSSLSSVVIYT